jgi:hypothetical protein
MIRQHLNKLLKAFSKDRRVPKPFQDHSSPRLLMTPSIQLPRKPPLLYSRIRCQPMNRMVSRPLCLIKVDLFLVQDVILAQQRALHQERTSGQCYRGDRAHLGRPTRLHPLRQTPLEYQLRVYSKISAQEMPRAPKLAAAELYLVSSGYLKQRVISSKRPGPRSG